MDEGRNVKNIKFGTEVDQYNSYCMDDKSPPKL